jgi:hypothetical protein
VHSTFRLHAHKALGGLLLAAAIILAGCHNNNQDAGYGIGWTTLTADPDPRFASYLVVVDSVVLNGKADGAVTAIATPELVDLTKLKNISELWAGASIPIDTYTGATITLDYTSAQISVMVNGVPQAVTVQDSTGAAPTQVVVGVLLDPAEQLTLTNTLSATDAHRLAFTFDMLASNSLDFTKSPVVLTINPYMTFSIAAMDKKLIRVRGPLINSSLVENTYTVTTRPFFDEVDSLGILTLFNTPSTIYSIAGSTVVGAPGLTTLSTSSAGSTMTAAYTTFQPTTVPQPGVIAGIFTPQYVIAGGTLEDFFTDGLEGDVVARSGNTITLRGSVLSQTSAQTVNLIIPDSTVTLGPGTLVTSDGIAGLSLNSGSVSVGQHVIVRGILTSVDGTSGAVTFDASGTANTDTGSVRIVSQDTLVSGPVVAVGSGSVTLDVPTINGYPASAFNFTGTNSNPAAYLVNTGALTLPTDPAGNPLAVGDFLAVNGFSSAFGTAPPDFIASAVNAEGTVPAVMHVIWTAGNPAPFATATGTQLTVNLVAALATTDPTSALTVFMPVFSVGSFTAGISGFNSLAPFEASVATLIAATPTTPATQFMAYGFYDSAANTFTASRINLVL